MPSVMTRKPDQSSAQPPTESPDAPPLLPRAAAHCVRCGYQWFPRAKTPVRCPKCGSIRWNIERAYKLAGKPAPTRQPKARGVAYDSQTGAEAANIRYEQERAGEGPPSNAPPGTPTEKE